MRVRCEHRWVLAFFAGTSACSESFDVVFPDLGDVQSRIVIVDSRSSIELYAMSANAPFTVAIDTPPRVVILGLAETLETLAIPEGKLSIPSETLDARPLPRWQVAFEADFESGRATTFTEVDHLDDRVAFLKFDDQLEACVSGGGCLSDDHCVTPCPAVELSPILEPDPPARAALPVLTPCAPGFVETRVDPRVDLAACVPAALPITAECPDGQIEFRPGEGCMDVGEPCPEGDWPLLPMNVPIIHARAGAVGGDGSASTPYGTLALAIAAASPGSIIALARGDYQSGPTLPADVSIFGACEKTTRILPSGLAPLVEVAGGNAEIRNVRFVGGTLGVMARNGAHVTIAHASFLASETQGIVARSLASINASRILIRETAKPGIQADRSFVHLEDSVIERARDYGLHIYGREARIEANRVRISGTRLSQMNLGGDGIAVDQGQLVADDLLIEDSVRRPMSLYSGTATISRMTSRLSIPGSHDASLIAFGSTVSISASTLDGGSGCALTADSGFVKARDVVVSNYVRAACTLHEGRTRLERVFIDRSSAPAIAAYDGETSLDHVWIHEPRAEDALILGVGKMAMHQLLVTSTEMSRGVELRGDQVIADATFVGPIAFPIQAFSNTHLDIQRLTLEDVRTGILLDTATATITDIIATRMLDPEEATLVYSIKSVAFFYRIDMESVGEGIVAQEDTQMFVRDVRARNVRAIEDGSGCVFLTDRQSAMRVERASMEASDCGFEVRGGSAGTLVDGRTQNVDHPMKVIGRSEALLRRFAGEGAADSGVLVDNAEITVEQFSMRGIRDASLSSAAIRIGAYSRAHVNDFVVADAIDGVVLAPDAGELTTIRGSISEMRHAGFSISAQRTIRDLLNGVSITKSDRAWLRPAD